MLADRLHKTIEEIEALPYARFLEHLAYLKITKREKTDAPQAPPG